MIYRMNLNDQHLSFRSWDIIVFGKTSKRILKCLNTSTRQHLLPETLSEVDNQINSSSQKRVDKHKKKLKTYITVKSIKIPPFTLNPKTSIIFLAVIPVRGLVTALYFLQFRTLN